MHRRYMTFCSKTEPNILMSMNYQEGFKFAFLVFADICLLVQLSCGLPIRKSNPMLSSHAALSGLPLMWTC